MWENLGPIVTIGIFIFNILIAGVAAWIALYVRRILDGEIATINKKFDSLNARFDEIRRDAAGRSSETSREFGETVRAIREHIHQIELAQLRTEKDAAEKYVLRESYHQHNNQVQSRWDAGERALEASISKLDEKIDRILQQGTTKKV